MPRRPAPTHFLCLPLAGPQLARSWAAFRADVTSPRGADMPAGAVRPLGTLHLTLGVMSLGEDGLDRATDLLCRSQPKELLAQLRAPAAASKSRDPTKARGAARTFSLSLRGLQTMRSASKASVLYATPTDREGLLARLCEQLRAPFIAQGLIQDDGRPLLLHVTVVNTVYVRGAGGRGGQRVTLDAREALRRYAAYVWAEDVPLEKLAICKMGAKVVEGADGDMAYEVVAEQAF